MEVPCIVTSFFSPVVCIVKCLSLLSLIIDSLKICSGLNEDDGEELKSRFKSSYAGATPSSLSNVEMLSAEEETGGGVDTTNTTTNRQMMRILNAIFCCINNNIFANFSRVLKCL